MMYRYLLVQFFVFSFALFSVCALDSPLTEVDGVPSVTTAKAIPAVIRPRMEGFADIVEPLIPTVVNVYSIQYRKKHKITPFDNMPFDPFSNFFDQFSNSFGFFEELYSNPKAVSLGSGFAIDSIGHIVTNYHVIRNADEIHVKLNDNTELPAKVIGVDQRTDLALLKIDPKSPLAFAKFGDNKKARVGDWVIAIGNPFGFGGTVTSGIISSKSRDIADFDGVIDDFIQTDAPINNGNSGGPLFNLDGEVIGVNTAIFSPSGTNVGIGFAIPSSTVRDVIEKLKAHGKISRGRLDITIQSISDELAEGLGLKDSSGVLVVDVMPSGAGEKCGLKAGDVIVEFAGQGVKNSRKLQILISEAPLNKDIRIVVMRGGKTQELTAKIYENKELDGKVTKSSGDIEFDKDIVEVNGVSFMNITESVKNKLRLKLSKGVVVVKVNKEKGYGFKSGDVIMTVNQENVNNISDLHKIVENAKRDKKKNLVLLIKRYDMNLFIAMPLTLK